MRHAARLVLLDEKDRLLLFRARTPQGDAEFWVTPGGGLLDGENHEAAARREMIEETGLEGEIGPCVWTRRHLHRWGERWIDQHERYYVTRVTCAELDPSEPDDYTLDHRWWTLEEIESAPDVFAPRRLAELLPAILRGEYPDAPIDTGV